MKTTIKKSGNKGILFTLLMLFISIYSKAEGENKFLEIVTKNKSGIYIIGGVLGFGIALYLISKIVSRYSKDVEVNQTNTRMISHRYKHHNRVIKKSA